jgi:uncharacterized protein (DUF2336 family)
VEKLLRDDSTETRVEIIHKVSEVYCERKLNEDEMLLAEQIFRLLVRDSVVKIRETLSENLKSSPHIPKDIVLDLARDVESVATPVLSMSGVLSDDDIVNVVRNTSEVWRYLAVTARQELSEDVTGALVETGERDVLYSLLDNTGAAFSEATCADIAARAGQDEDLARTLAARPSLPVAVVEKLLLAVSDDIARQLRDTHRIDEEQITSETHHAVEQSTMELIALRNDRAQTAELVGWLHENDRLSASLIINALCHGNLDFFELSLAILAGIPEENAHVLVHDPGKRGFHALYSKSGLPMTMLDAVRLLFMAVRRAVEDGARPGSPGFSMTVVQHLTALAHAHPVDSLSYILALIRRSGKNGN